MRERPVRRELLYKICPVSANSLILATSERRVATKSLSRPFAGKMMKNSFGLMGFVD